MIIAIDLHNIRDGGGVNYIRNLLGAADPERDGFSEIHLIGAPRLLDAYPQKPWLIRHALPVLDRSLPHRLWFVATRLPRLLRKIGCDVLYAPGGLSLGGFRPRVTISRNMMPFRPEFWSMYPRFSADRLRLWLLRWVNVATFKSADGMIFLSETARQVIAGFIGRPLKRVAVIAHGLNHALFRPLGKRRPPDSPMGRMTIVYPSRLEPYKHQIEVASALERLSAEFPSLELILYGPANPAYLAAYRDVVEKLSCKDRIEYCGEVPNGDLPGLYAAADLLIFASSCENLPNILIEAMACGIPICCSDRSPMPEIAKDACLYFDPTDAASIAAAVRSALLDHDATLARAELGVAYARDYSWANTARRTFAFLTGVTSRAVG